MESSRGQLADLRPSRKVARLESVGKDLGVEGRVDGEAVHSSQQRFRTQFGAELVLGSNRIVLGVEANPEFGERRGSIGLEIGADAVLDRG
jgi:hypothetical protein